MYVSNTLENLSFVLREADVIPFCGFVHSILVGEGPLEEGMATHASILA